MARFDIHAFAGRPEAAVPFLLVLNHPLVDLGTVRIAAPCYPAEAYGPPVSRINVPIEIEGQPYVVALQELGGISTRTLGKRVGNAEHLADEISHGLDLLFNGF